MISLCEDFSVPAPVHERLYPYQREGVQWMWRVYKGIRDVRGGILGDDMGLGKTFQVTSFLAGLANVNSKMTALIVVPVSLISTWEDTLNEYMPVMCGICVLHGAVTGKKEDALRKIRADGGVCITTYGAISADGDVAKLVGSHSSIESTVQWSVVVMDEANKVKNPSAMVQVCDAARQLRADAKLLLTGTPIQNNLEELWALFDIACNGKLFGERALFSAQYRHPIERGQDKRASKEDIMRGKQLTQKLRDVFEPHFLRRDKAAMQALMKESGVEMKLGSIGNMPQKHELIIWTKLSDVQLEAYKAFLESDQVKALLGSTESPLIAINVLRKICAHTLLLSAKTPTSEVEDDDAQQRITAIAGGNFKTVDDMVADAERLTAMSCKMQFLLQLLHSFKEEGHRALVFSQSVLMLDIVEAILRQQSLSYSRLDGSIVNPKKRHAIVQEFNADASKLVCLLSKGVGATGLTLTGADRVVILDPDWNPAVDAQAVDRAYRIGQTRPVVTYRLVTCGTIEEAIYRRQVFKSGLTNSVMRKDKAGKGERYMSDSDLRDCFKLGDIHRPVTKTLLESVSTDSASASGSECESPHFIALELQAATSHCYAGISYHHKLFKPAAATTTRRRVTLSDEQLQLQPATKKKRARKSTKETQLQPATKKKRARKSTKETLAAFDERISITSATSRWQRTQSPFLKALQQQREERLKQEAREQEEEQQISWQFQGGADLESDFSLGSSPSPSPSLSSQSEVIVIDDSDDDDDEQDLSPRALKRIRTSSDQSFFIDLCDDDLTL